MLSVRIQAQDYRVSNETLDRLFGRQAWRRFVFLEDRVRDQHAAGRLIIQGRRLRLASRMEEAEHLLRYAEDPDEMLRSGFLYLASHVAALASELRALRESLEFDTSAATASLSRDRTEA
jgi:hypothetical protein